MVRKARELINSELQGKERQLLNQGKLTTHPDVVGMLNDTALAEILRNTMGSFPEVISSQIAFTPGHDVMQGLPEPHIDGSWSGQLPTNAAEIDSTTGRPINAAKWFGSNDDKRGTNDGQLWIDRERTVSTGSYTCLVGVALNDQSKPGNGQFGVIQGVNSEVEECFKRQRDSGGVVGPEGVDWTRVRIADDDNVPYANGLFDSIRAKYWRGKVVKDPADGWPWPELRPVLLDKGDAVITLHSTPHCATPNLGPNMRENVYFRIRRLRPENPHEGTRQLAHGVSDHPDVGYFGKELAYPRSYDPFKTSTERLCDHWSEWDGMQELASGALSNDTAQ
jgi:hypothetical protein